MLILLTIKEGKRYVERRLSPWEKTQVTHVCPVIPTTRWPHRGGHWKSSGQDDTFCPFTSTKGINENHTQQTYSQTQTAVRLITEKKGVKKDEGTEGSNPRGQRRPDFGQWAQTEWADVTLQIVHLKFIYINERYPIYFIVKILNRPFIEDMFHFFQQKYVFVYLPFVH